MVRKMQPINLPKDQITHQYFLSFDMCSKYANSRQIMLSEETGSGSDEDKDGEWSLITQNDDRKSQRSNFYFVLMTSFVIEQYFPPISVSLDNETPKSQDSSTTAAARPCFSELLFPGLLA